MIFGLNSIKKTREEDILDTPIISIVTDKTARKLHFNLEAYKLLGLKQNEKNSVAISFSNAYKGDIFIINGNEFDSHANLNLNKSRFITNKRYAEELVKSFYPDNSEKDIKLVIERTEREFQGKAVFKLKLYNPEEEAKKKEYLKRELVITNEDLEDIIEIKEEL